MQDFLIFAFFPWIANSIRFVISFYLLFLKVRQGNTELVCLLKVQQEFRELAM